MANSLYYVDLFGKAYYRYSYNGDNVYKLVVDSFSYADFSMPIDCKKNCVLIGLTVGANNDTFAGGFGAAHSLPAGLLYNANIGF